MTLLKRRRAGLAARAEDAKKNSADPVDEDIDGEDKKKDDEKAEEHDKDDEKAEEHEDEKKDAVAVERRRVAEIQREFGDQPAFASQAIEKGWSASEAKSIAYDRMKAAGSLTPKKNRSDVADAADGVDNAPAAGSDGGGRSDFGIAIDDYIAEHKGVTRSRAASIVSRRNPELQQAAVAAAN